MVQHVDSDGEVEIDDDTDEEYLLDDEYQTVGYRFGLDKVGPKQRQRRVNREIMTLQVPFKCFQYFYRIHKTNICITLETSKCKTLKVQHQ